MQIQGLVGPERKELYNGFIPAIGKFQLEIDFQLERRFHQFDCDPSCGYFQWQYKKQVGKEETLHVGNLQIEIQVENVAVGDAICCDLFPIVWTLQWSFRKCVGINGGYHG